MVFFSRFPTHICYESYVTTVLTILLNNSLKALSYYFDDVYFFPERSHYFFSILSHELTSVGVGVPFFTAFFFIVCCMGSGIKSSSVNFLLVQRIVFNATPKPIRSLAFWICFRQLKRSAIRALVLVNPDSQSEKSVSRLTSANQNSFLKCVIKEEVTTNRAVRNARTVVVGYRLCP